ncbi:uncharacterized protein LOC108412130 [Pygocentrus nattereri]|uniref:IRS-type PTB domain-containing protein n=1 Tax=Pygocentrus nattereri TaxID=42514 RepID=A0A3B4CXT1_PYGNA|nr:uncharacterized protein LOC108412130 [Pygocentrus nattereri]
MMARPESPSCKSEMSDNSRSHPIDFKRDPDDESVMSGMMSSTHLYSCIPVVNNPPQEDPQEHRPSPRYAEAGDVACDLCEGRKLKALKSCMTCLASFCDSHVRDHYTIEALQRHLLVEVTRNLSVLQENAQLKKMIKEERSEKTALRDENQALRKEVAMLRQTICELRLPDFLTPAAVASTMKDFQVSVRYTDAVRRCGLQGQYLLQTNFDSLILKEPKTGEVLYTWPYHSLRSYGRDKTMFSFEAGRRCDSGQGVFEFDTNQGNTIYQYVESAINQVLKAQTQRSQPRKHKHVYEQIDESGITSTFSHHPGRHPAAHHEDSAVRPSAPTSLYSDPEEVSGTSQQILGTVNDPSGHEYPYSAYEDDYVFAKSPTRTWNLVQELGNDEDEDCTLFNDVTVKMRTNMI